MNRHEKAAMWFEHNMPPMPGAREMYRTAVEALRGLPRLRAERDALLEVARDGATCDNCLHAAEVGKCDEDAGPCADCMRDCYCKDCQDHSKWDLSMWEGKANGQ